MFCEGPLKKLTCQRFSRDLVSLHSEERPTSCGMGWSMRINSSQLPCSFNEQSQRLARHIGTEANHWTRCLQFRLQDFSLYNYISKITSEEMIFFAANIVGRTQSRLNLCEIESLKFCKNLQFWIIHQSDKNRLRKNRYNVPEEILTSDYEYMT